MKDNNLLVPATFEAGYVVLPLEDYNILIAEKKAAVDNLQQVFKLKVSYNKTAIEINFNADLMYELAVAKYNALPAEIKLGFKLRDMDELYFGGSDIARTEAAAKPEN